MRFSLFLFLLISSCLLLPTTALAVVVAPPTEAAPPTAITDLDLAEIVQLDQTAMAQKMGRKLKWKERIAVRVIKRTWKKQQKQGRSATETKKNGLAIAGFVCSLIGLMVLPIPLSLLGIIFSAVAIGQTTPGANDGRGLAGWGLGLGIVGTLVGLLLLTASGGSGLLTLLLILAILA